jgi:hypothetical protein
VIRHPADVEVWGEFTANGPVLNARERRQLGSASTIRGVRAIAKRHRKSSAAQPTCSIAPTA